MTSWSPPSGAEPATRRAPFSQNPEVGVRGRRSQQRIFDAAMRCFDELGYERSTVDRITKAAGCSRAVFYQYFSGKEELFRQVAGQASSELSESEMLLGPVTADQAGWDEIWRWVKRHNVIHDRYEPLFRAYDVAVELDAKVASDTAILTARYARQFQAKVSDATVPDGRTAAVVTLLNKLVTRTKRLTSLLLAASPTSPLDDDRVSTAVADVVHRTLFGPNSTNSRRLRPAEPSQHGPLGAAFREQMDQADVPAGLNAAAQRTLATLLEASQSTLLTNGYHRTRVSGITAAAGQSHGIFYHYFSGKEEVTRILAMRALRRLVDAYGRMPDLGAAGDFDPTELRRWLRDYGSSHAREAGMIRVWMDSTEHDKTLLRDAAAGLEWAREWMAAVLEQRKFGDPAADALVLVALLDVLGEREPSRRDVDIVALVIELGLVGKPAGA